RLNQKPVPTDGVQWRDRDGHVVAESVEWHSPADYNDIRPGDILYGISLNGKEPFEEIRGAQYVQLYIDQAKDQIKEGIPLSYWIVRLNAAGDTVIHQGIADFYELGTRPTHLPRGIYLALIGLIYLGIGIYVLLQQGRAPYVTHFFVLCLLAFIVHFSIP